MLNEQKKSTYEISPLTMAVIPKNDETGAINTIVLEESGTYYVSTPPTRLIDLACRYFGSSLKGRQHGTKEVSRITYKAPIAIDPSTGMFFFPTTSPRNRKCSWINHSHVDDVRPMSHNKSKVVFNNGQSTIINISHGSILNQLHRTAQFRYLLESRMKEIQQEIEKGLPQYFNQIK